jgi:hypothetical protein
MADLAQLGLEVDTSSLLGLRNRRVSNGDQVTGSTYC